jgi:hypothetical protein
VPLIERSRSGSGRKTKSCGGFSVVRVTRGVIVSPRAPLSSPPPLYHHHHHRSSINRRNDFFISIVQRRPPSIVTRALAPGRRDEINEPTKTRKSRTRFRSPPSRLLPSWGGRGTLRPFQPPLITAADGKVGRLVAIARSSYVFPLGERKGGRGGGREKGPKFRLMLYLYARRPEKSVRSMKI